MKETLLWIADIFDLVIVNTWFTKTERQLITLKSDNTQLQIDYKFIIPRHLRDTVNYKTIPYETVVSQHRLVVMDLRTRLKESRCRRENEVRIMWWRLMHEAAATDCSTDIINSGDDDSEYDWTTLWDTVKEMGSRHFWIYIYIYI